MTLVARVTVIRVLTSYAAALALTLLIEVPFWTAALVALRLIRPARAVALAVAVNLATHPALWWFLATNQKSPGTTLSAECAVVLAEWGLAALALRREAALPALVSVGANAASYLAGLVLVAAPAAAATVTVGG
jgi:hypothetical protein